MCSARLTNTVPSRSRDRTCIIWVSRLPVQAGAKSLRVALKSCSAWKASARPYRRGRCLFLEEDRKRAARGQSDAIDPKPTCRVLIEAAIIAARPSVASKASKRYPVHMPIVARSALGTRSWFLVRHEQDRSLGRAYRQEAASLQGIAFACFG
jgi:hypothetical protein